VPHKGGIQNFDVQVQVSSAAGSPPVYPQVAVRLYTNGGAPITSSANGTTISAVVAELSSLVPGGSSRALVTAISSLGTTNELVFKPGDPPRNRAFRMEITVTPYAGAQFSQPATDTNPGNDVINFWLMRAC